MTNDIVKIKSVAASQGGETEHGLMLDSSILSYTYQGSSKTVKWILDTIFTLLGGKAASSHTHGLISNGSQKVECKSTGAVDITATSVGGSAVLSGSATLTNTDVLATSKVISDALAGKANSSHTHSQSDITGLSTALANKLSSSVHYELLNTQSSKKNLSSMTIGDLYLFKNQYSKQLSQIINNDVTGAHLYFHQGAGSIATDYIMVRIYKWELPDGTDERLCEIVGAWDA